MSANLTPNASPPVERGFGDSAADQTGQAEGLAPHDTKSRGEVKILVFMLAILLLASVFYLRDIYRVSFWED